MAGHIPGGLHIHLGYLEQNAHWLPTDKPIIVHCQGGTRSPIAASLLTARQYPQVLDMASGFNHWQQAGFPIVKGA